MLTLSATKKVQEKYPSFTISEARQIASACLEAIEIEETKKGITFQVVEI